MTTQAPPLTLSAVAHALAEARTRYSTALAAGDIDAMLAAKDDRRRLEEAHAVARIAAQHTVIAAAHDRLERAQQAIGPATVTAQEARDANLAADGLLYELRKKAAHTAAILDGLARDVAAAQAAVQAEERALPRLIMEITTERWDR